MLTSYEEKKEQHKHSKDKENNCNCFCSLLCLKILLKCFECSPNYY